MEDEKQQPSKELNSAPFVLTTLDTPVNNEPGEAMKAGDLCPNCHTGQLDYDGCLNLACPVCGYAIGGCFT
jgi:hypothetical protein